MGLIVLPFIGNVSSNFKHAYPTTDGYMKEMDNNAKVFLVYYDEANRIDSELVDGWLNTLDTLLLFVRSSTSALCFTNTMMFRPVSSPQSSSLSSLRQPNHYNRILPRSRHLSSQNLYSFNAQPLQGQVSSTYPAPPSHITPALVHQDEMFG